MVQWQPLHRKVISPIHEYLYLDSPAVNGGKSGSDSDIRQFAVQADGSLRRLSPSSVSAGDDSESMVADGPHRTLYADDIDATLGTPFLRPYHIRRDGTLEPLPSVKLAALSSGISYLKIDPRDHSLYIATPSPPKQRPVKDYWYRCRIRRDGSLLMPLRHTVPPVLPTAAGYIYVMYRKFVDIRRIMPNGILKSVAHQPVPFTPPDIGPTDLTVAPPGRYAYLSYYDIWSPLAAYRIGKDGRLTLLSAKASSVIAAGRIAADPSGRFLYAFDRAADHLNAYRIRPNGLLTLVQSFWVCPNLGSDFVRIEVVKISQ